MRKKLLSFILLFQTLAVIAQTQYGWIQRAEFPGPARHRAASASVGNRGYIGMGHINAVVDILYDDWFEYDPGTDSWMQKANFPGGPRMQPATFVINDTVYVGTGRDVATTLHQDFWKYNVVTNAWTQIAPYPGAGRRGAVAFVLNGLGYVGTGSYHSNFFRYDPSNDTWTAVSNLPGTGRISSVACAINGKGYLSTGDDGAGPLGDMWEYDPLMDTWTAKANLPGLPRMEAGGFVLNGKFYVGCGDDFSSGTNYGDFWCYDPSNNSWIQVADFAGAARRYPATFVIGNRAYLGTGTSGINYSDLWEFGSISGVEESAVSLNGSVYPNPMHESATVKLDRSVANATASITDISGRILRTEKFSGSEYQFSREDLTSGIYFITITGSYKAALTQKILIN